MNHLQDMPLQLWGGLECTVNRVRDTYHCQVRRNGHAQRREDIGRFASLGIGAIRYPVLWESVAPRGLRHADWTLPDERLPLLREHGVEPIVGLVHHGSGPRHTSLLDRHFAPQLATFALAVARRYPWLSHWTPVNEPLTTARFSGLYGVWFPHARSDRAFVRALVNQCRAVVLCMAAVRSVNPAARLVQTDDLGQTRGTPEVADIVEFYNHRRWLGWDLLCGLVDRAHPLWGYLCGNGIEPGELRWFLHHRCPPDVVGVNHYVTSDRWVDHRVEHYPASHCGPAQGREVADVEAVRAHHEPPAGVAPLLRQAWERYGLPLAVTEAHIDARREDQMRWLLDVWRAAQRLRGEGADVRAVTVWALLGSFDWNCLVTQCRGHYEPGPFDVRGPQPRPTALARLMRRLARGEAPDELPDEPALQGQGWWRRPRELLCRAPGATDGQVVDLQAYRAQRRVAVARPILVVGSGLATQVAAACLERQLQALSLGPDELDLADPVALERALRAYRPWAVVNVNGLRVHGAVPARGAQAEGAALLARACATAGARLVHFSSGAELFEGHLGEAAVESDAPCPRGPQAQAALLAERAVLRHCSEALVLRTGAVLGQPFGTDLLDAAAGRADAAGGSGEPLPACLAHLPDVVHTALDLLIDHEQQVWHLAHAGPAWHEGLARLLREDGAAEAAGLVPVAPGPRLATQRGIWLPPLEGLVRSWLAWQAQARAAAEPPRRDRSA